MNKETKKRKKIKALDGYLVLSISAVIIFSITHTILTAITGIEQSTLTTCFFAFFGGEILALAKIKRDKLKKGNTNEMDM